MGCIENFYQITDNEMRGVSNINFIVYYPNYIDVLLKLVLTVIGP